jgi:hypothetical protein
MSYEKAVRKKKTRQICASYTTISFNQDKETTNEHYERLLCSLSSASRLRGSYLEALSEITRLSYQQPKELRSDLTWQDWSQQNPDTTTHSA